MTIEQAKKKILDAKSIIRNKELEIQETEKAIIALAPFKIGDKVRVEKGGKAHEVYVSEISVYYNLEFDYKFTKPKKDGTMGGQGARLSYYAGSTKITKI